MTDDKKSGEIEAKAEKAVKKEVREKRPKVGKARKTEKPAKKEKMTKDFKPEAVDVFESIHHVLMTEKAIQLIESQNKLAFVVRRTATKRDVKKAVEHLFKTPVVSVNTVIDQEGKK